MQILDRIGNTQSIVSNWNHFKSFANVFNTYDKNKRLIIGSCWQQECEIFKNSDFVQAILEKKLFVAIAPHRIHDENISTIIGTINDLAPQLKISIIKDDVPFQNEGDIFIVQKSGLLLELFTFFGHAFIGGGYGRSVHSVLEPFMAGCFCILWP